MTEGFRRLARIRNRTLTLTVKAPSREEPISFNARIGDLFERDLMQALLLDWHINYPVEVWANYPAETYVNEDGEQEYDPGNRWLEPMQNHLQRWAGDWNQAFTEALPLEEDDDGNRTLEGPLELSDTEAYELTASLLEARMPPGGNMTAPGLRAGKILAYAESYLIESIFEQEGYTKTSGMGQSTFITRSLSEHINEGASNGWSSHTPETTALTFENRHNTMQDN